MSKNRKLRQRRIRRANRSPMGAKKAHKRQTGRTGQIASRRIPKKHVSLGVTLQLRARVPLSITLLPTAHGGKNDDG